MAARAAWCRAAARRAVLARQARPVRTRAREQRGWRRTPRATDVEKSWDLLTTVVFPARTIQRPRFAIILTCPRSRNRPAAVCARLNALPRDPVTNGRHRAG